MTLTGAERQRAYRRRHKERLRQEAAAKRERERQRDLPADAECRCCGETRPVFLATEARCHNCAHAEQAFGLCPHKGISRVLG